MNFIKTIKDDVNTVFERAIYYHCIRLSFLRPHITKRSEGKMQ